MRKVIKMKDIDFDKVKYPEFIRKIHFPPTIKYDGENLTVKAEMKASAITVARIDNMLVERISEIAKEHGITDLYILDKENIASALQKQIPKKPIICTDTRDVFDCFGGVTETYETDVLECPVCGEYLIDKEALEEFPWLAKYNYCNACGQALDWGQEDDR